MEKETQQREVHALTKSLPHHHDLSKSGTPPRKKQLPDQQEIERLLQIFDQLKPHILWVIIVTIAIYDYFHPANVVGFLILIAAAAGAISLSQAIALLQGRSMPKKLSSPSEEKATEDQDEPM
jgi:hypothetical protein